MADTAQQIARGVSGAIDGFFGFGQDFPSDNQRQVAFPRIPGADGTPEQVAPENTSFSDGKPERAGIGGLSPVMLAGIGLAALGVVVFAVQD